MVKFIPNLFTLGNLFCGSLAVIFIFEDKMYLVPLLIAISAFLDFFDGFIARAVNASGPLGKELDSLADMVSFGLVPGLIMYDFSKQAQITEFGMENYYSWGPYLALVITLASCYRLANFNISTGATGNANGITDLIIQDAGNGWYRIGGKLTTGTTSFNYFVTLIQSDVASRFQTYTGTDKGQYIWGAQATKSATLKPYLRNIGTAAITDDVLLPQGLTTGRDITGVNLFENVRKQGALNLDGNSWAEVHDNASLDITDAITFEAWVYWDGLQLSKGIFGRYSNPDFSFLIYANYDVRVDAYFAQSGSTNYASMTIGWRHIVGTFDGTTQRLYVDGVNVASTTYVHTMITGTTPIEIGRYDQNSSLAYGNQIAQPRIYNRALTAEEVQRNYNAGKNTYTN